MFTNINFWFRNFHSEDLKNFVNIVINVASYVEPPAWSVKDKSPYYAVTNVTKNSADNFQVFHSILNVIEFYEAWRLKYSGNYLSSFSKRSGSHLSLLHIHNGYKYVKNVLFTLKVLNLQVSKCSKYETEKQNIN